MPIGRNTSCEMLGQNKGWKLHSGLKVKGAVKSSPEAEGYVEIGTFLQCSVKI